MSKSDMGVKGAVIQTHRLTEAYLNGKAQELAVQGLSLRVYYWGVNPVHLDNPVHKHSFFESCYVLDGEGTYLDEGTVHPLKKGTLFLSRPGIVHQIRSETGMYLLYVAFELDPEGSEELWKESFGRLEKTAATVREDADELPTALIWRALLGQAEENERLQAESTRQLAIALIVSFLGAFGGQEQGEARRSLSRPSSELLYRAQLFIRDNLSEPLPLEHVAAYLHVSARHLSRVFSEETGVTFTEYVRAERIREACMLLRSGSSSIKQIAAETGFGSVHYFTRVFAGEVGMTPGQYRRIHTGINGPPIVPL